MLVGIVLEKEYTLNALRDHPRNGNSLPENPAEINIRKRKEYAGKKARQ